MANKHYDEFCRADMSELPTLHRQLLGHMCARFNESKTPPRAFPPIEELVRITGVHKGSVSRALTNLIRNGWLFRVTYPKNKWKAEYAPNLIKIRQRITDELSIDNEQVTEKVVIGNTAVFNGLPVSYPKPNKPNKPTTQLFDDLLTVIPKDKHFIATAEIISLIEKLKQYGTSYNDLKADLKVLNWFPIYAPKEFVISLIKEKLDKPPRYSFEVKPKWCGQCNEVTRKLVEPVEIPNGNGSITFSCLSCDPFMVNKRNGY